uniref:AlNc14C1104G12777 protein n=1 Tax=Albugo laibachii Nc14 TaxID=890382 RepID=F0X092_9STRA|nr:AlNc14C470G11830 [Albugo laibachii Nc14]CCA28087.1 AlNc14C1104G12777 [Albugo laibachii Nc14]|eukprot:CCA28087.1 AlNc14C1104G12777 [Albugo laibachii Nc14]
MGLFCLCLGEGNVFSVDVEQTDVVSELKRKIAMEKPNKIQCDADELALYLAKKNGTFLSDRDTDVAKLSGCDCSQVVKYSYLKDDVFMGSTRRLHRFFDEDTQLEDVIRVLLQLPATACNRLKVCKDITFIYAGKLRELNICALTTPEALGAYISSPLPMKCPTNNEGLLKAFPDDI